MNIALKEASETDYWLELLKATNYMDARASESIISDCTELNTMIASIVKTTKENLKVIGKWDNSQLSNLNSQL